MDWWLNCIYQGDLIFAVGAIYIELVICWRLKCYSGMEDRNQHHKKLHVCVWNVWEALDNPDGTKRNSNKPIGGSNECFGNVSKIYRNMMKSSDNVYFCKNFRTMQIMTKILYMWDRIIIKCVILLNALWSSVGRQSP